MSNEARLPLPHPDGPLAGYRVLDFADEKGQLCARVLGELGADVIKVEPRGGHPTRENGPFFRDEQGPLTSLYWWAMNAGKRSITCELRLEQGRELVRKLVAASDIVIETCEPGTARDFGLDYETLREANPGIIVVSITPFGQTGPYAKLKATDIVASAMGGHMHLNGDDENGPVRTTVPQAYAQANFHGATGAMIALYARGVNNGMGQHVDVSMQEAMANAMDHAQQTWDIRHKNSRGPGIYRERAGERVGRYLYEAADGWITTLANGGISGLRGNGIIDWLEEHGAARDLAHDNWRLKLTTLEPLTPEEQAYVEETLELFCRQHPKDWLVAEAQARGGGWAPVYSPREIVEAEQLKARDYWVSVHHEDLGESFIYPGAPFKLSRTPWKQRGRAPHVGEHTTEVFDELLGMGEAEVKRLRTRMVI
jgi:benzylsuccinate CoA-transferase BbsE subunit